MPKKLNGQYSLFPEKVYEYFILLSPDDAIKEAVDRLKQALHDTIGLEDHNLRSIAHVSLYKQEAPESVDVHGRLKKLLAGQKKFTVKLAGHEVLKHGSVSRTLCLRVEDPAPINNIMALLDPRKAAKKVNRQISILDKPVRPPKIIYPHITIARNIPAADFELLGDLSQFDLYDEWLCDRITILRRIAGTDKHFSPWKEIKLG